MSTTTYQTVALDSKEGKAFLRKVARGDGWSINASLEDDWRVRFCRTIGGKVGEPNQYVEVVADTYVRLGGRSGKVRPFSDGCEVIVPPCRRVSLRDSDARTAARLLLEGWRLEVVHSAGSSNSSQHGLAFVSLHFVNRNGERWDSVEVGTAAVFVNGVQVICGACSCEGGY